MHLSAKGIPGSIQEQPAMLELQHSDAGLAEYWSLGKTKAFIADIMDVQALQEGFAGRAYNNELIIFNGDSSPNMLEMVCCRHTTALNCSMPILCPTGTSQWRAGCKR